MLKSCRLAFFLKCMFLFSGMLSPLAAQEIPYSENGEHEDAENTEIRRSAEPEDREIQTDYITGRELTNLFGHRHIPDTSLDEFQRFDIGDSPSNYRFSLGSAGTGHLWHTPRETRKPGFSSGINPFEMYRYTGSNTQFFDTYTPYTEVTYIQGQPDLQITSARHTRNVLPNLNFGFEMERWRSQGFYFRENLLDTRGRIHAGYESLSRRYNLYASASWNRFIREESGGIASHQSFRQAADGDRIRETVLLDNAESWWDDKNLFIYQTWSFGPSHKDTVYGKDTTWITSLDPTWKAFIESNLQKSRFHYEDEATDPEFYPIYRSGGAGFSDSLHHRSFSNRAGIKTGSYSRFRDSIIKRSLRGSAGVVLQHDDYSYGFTDSSFLNQGFFLSGAWEIENLKLQGEAEVITTGNLSGEWQGKIKATGELSAESRLSVMAEAGDFHPDMYENIAVGPAAFWRNSFAMIRYRSGQIRADLFADRLFLSGELHEWENYIYFNSQKQPAQHDRLVRLFRVRAGSRIRLGGLVISGSAFFQQPPAEVLQIPDWGAEGNVYFERIYFDAMRARIGIEGRVFASHYLPGYMPFAGRLHTQHAERAGHYPFLDAYISGQIQQVRFFIRYDHFHAGFTGSNYFLARGYPQHPAAFRVGVNWKFFD